MSTSGVKWAAAVMPSELSIMQPTMTIMPCARATAIIRSASRRLPHLASLMLIPSTAPDQRRDVAGDPAALVRDDRDRRPAA